MSHTTHTIRLSTEGNLYAWVLTSRSHKALRTFSSKPASTITSSFGPGAALVGVSLEFAAGAAFSLHLDWVDLVGESPLDLGGDSDLLGVSGAVISRDSRERYGSRDCG